MTFEEIITNLKTTLKDKVLTADNTEAVTAIDKGLDSLLEENKKNLTALQETKDKLVEVVKGTSFSSPSGTQGKDEGTENLSLDEVIQNELNKILENEKEGK